MKSWPIETELNLGRTNLARLSHEYSFQQRGDHKVRTLGLEPSEIVQFSLLGYIARVSTPMAVRSRTL
jgi:hypothetical protein